MAFRTDPTDAITPKILPLVLLVFTLASALGINPYYYGTGDNRITIPFLKASLDPRLFPTDYLLDQRRFYYTYLWDVIGLLRARTGVLLPVLFFSCYLIALYFTLWGIYRIAVTLSRNRFVGLLAVVFVVAAPREFAGVESLETVFKTRAVALPLLLFAIDFFLRGRTVGAFALVGVAYLVHPLTTHYVLAMMAVAGAVQWRRRGVVRLLAGILAFVAIASPILLWTFRSHPISVHALSRPDPLWLTALLERSAHHVLPWSWDASAWVQFVLVVGLFVLCFRRRDRDADDQHRTMALMFWTGVATCAAGLVLTGPIPLSLGIITQPMRAFQFLEYFMVMYAANAFVVLIREARPRGLLEVGVIMLGVLYNAHRVLVPILIILAIGSYLLLARLKWRQEAGALAFAAFSAAWVSVSAVVCHVRDTNGGDIEPVSIETLMAPPALDLQRWARDSTEVQDGFIVPPDEEDEFRVESERSVYADWEDGGLMNGNPAFGIEWMRRMKRLGYDGPSGTFRYCALGEDSLRAIAKEIRYEDHDVFVVRACKRQELDFPVRYENDRYVVYEVPND